MIDIGLCIVTMGLIGSIIVWTFTQMSHSSSTDPHLILLTQLIEDTIKPCIHRLISNICQITIYIILCLGIFSFLVHKTPDIIVLLFLFIGAITPLIASLVLLKVTPRLIAPIITKAKLNYRKGCQLTFQASTGIGLLFLSLPMALLLAGLLWGSYPILLGLITGIVVVTFFLRISGGIIKSTSSTSLTKDKNSPTIRHPQSSLHYLGELLSNIIGFSSDLLSSFCITILAFITLSKVQNPTLLFSSPLILKKICIYVILLGLLSAIFGFFISSFRLKTKQTSNFLLENIYLAILTSAIGIYLILYYLVPVHQTQSFSLNDYWPYIIGLIGTIILCLSSEYLTSSRYKPAQNIAKDAQWGTAITCMNGFALGLKSNLIFLLIIISIIGLSIKIATTTGLILAALGMLSITCNIIIGKTFTSLSYLLHKATYYTPKLKVEQTYFTKIRRIGHTTIALGNGYASGSTLISCSALLLAWNALNPINLQSLSTSHILALLVGICIPHINAGYLLSGLKNTIITIHNETRRQFKEIPYLEKGTANPDMINFSDQTIKTTMDHLIIPGIITTLSPILACLLFDKSIALAMVLGSLLSTFSQGYYWGNVGDVISHAKNYIQAGHFGGPSSPTFEATRTAEQIGNSFKDTLGPSMTIFLKTIFMLALIAIHMFK